MYPYSIIFLGTYYWLCCVGRWEGEGGTSRRNMVWMVMMNPLFGIFDPFRFIQSAISPLDPPPGPTCSTGVIHFSLSHLVTEINRTTFVRKMFFEKNIIILTYFSHIHSPHIFHLCHITPDHPYQIGLQLLKKKLLWKKISLFTIYFTYPVTPYFWE